MNLIGNIIWIIFGGLMIAIEYIYQSMKLGIFALLPFGQKAVVNRSNTGCLSAIMNVIWFFVGGIWIVLTHLFWGVLLCITIIGIPFGKQHFKLMSLALTPFGRDVVSA